MIAAAFAHCPFAVRSPSSPVVAWVAYYPTPLCLRVVVSPFGSLLLLLSLVLLIIPPLLDVGFSFWTLALFSYYRFEGRSVCALSFRRSDLFLCSSSLAWFIVSLPLGFCIVSWKLAWCSCYGLMLASFAHSPFGARFSFCVGPFAHCPSAARCLALLVVPPPPEFAIVPSKAFVFYYGWKRAAFAHRPCRLVGFF